MYINGYHVKGAIDQETRCSHYFSKNDRIAIKFYCCGNYFPCYRCHEEFGCDKHAVWPLEFFDEHAIFCGGCKELLTINEYLNSNNICPYCDCLFNPSCSFHAHLYFSPLNM